MLFHRLDDRVPRPVPVVHRLDAQARGRRGCRPQGRFLGAAVTIGFGSAHGIRPHAHKIVHASTGGEDISTCVFKSFAYTPSLMSISSECTPCSTTRPFSSTTSRVAA